MALPPITPGTPIKLDEQTRIDLGAKLGNRISDMESTYRPYFNDIETWWKWYYAEPRQKEKNFPFKAASNIVVPLAQIASDGLVARAMGSLYGTGHRLWTVLTENEEFEGQARNVARYINWQANGNDFDFFLNIYDWLNEVYPIGSSVLALNWCEDKRYVWTGRLGRKQKAQPVRFSRGPKFEHSPRETYLWDTAFPIGEAPEIYRKFRFSFSQMRHLAENAEGWDIDTVESLRNDSGSDGPDDPIHKAKLKREGQEETTASTHEHDIREAHLDWPVLGEMGIGPGDVKAPGKEDKNTPTVPIVVTFHRKTNKVLRVIAEPYNLPFKPFFDGYFKKRPSRGSSEGVCKRLEQMQIAMTTVFNQSIDSNTRSNAIWAMTSKKAHLTNPIDVSRPIYAPTMEKEFRELNFSKNPQSDLALMQMAQVFAERQTGSSDPALGRETRHGGHPSPATSTLALLDQTAVMASGTTRMLRQRVSLMGSAVATLDQQFETDEDGKIDRAMGHIDGEDIRGFLFPTEPLFGNFRFDIVAMSEQTNPDSEMKRAITVSQMNTNYWSFVMQGAMALDSGKMGKTGTMVWLKAIEAQTNIHQKFLEATNVDDLEKFTLQLQAANDSAAGELPDRQQLQNIAGAGRELARGNGAVQDAGVQGPGNGAAGNPLGSLGATSV